MEEQLISFDTAKLTKEKGFNIPCYNAYRIYRENIRKSETEEKALRTIDVEYEPDYRGGSYAEVKKYYQSKEYTLAPTQSHLKDWFRINKNLHVSVHSDHGKWYWHIFDIINGGCLKSWHYDGDDEKTKKYTTHELAMEKALQEALKLI